MAGCNAPRSRPQDRFEIGLAVGGRGRAAQVPERVGEQNAEQRKPAHHVEDEDALAWLNRLKRQRSV